MKLAIMQPYFFPYIGYFQLIATSDIFVLHDDVQYIKAGWVNRNRILFNGKSRWMTFAVRNDSHKLPINARYYVEGKEVVADMANLLRAAYSKAPYFLTVYPFLLELLMSDDNNVARFNERLIRRIAEYIGLVNKIVISSALKKNSNLAGEARVIEICKRLSATKYINPVGGLDLYRPEAFERLGIALKFLRPKEKRYAQFGDRWTPYLSIIDVMMFNPVKDVRQLLTEYELLTPTRTNEETDCP